jgi:hypothetical protein
VVCLYTIHLGHDQIQKYQINFFLLFLEDGQRFKPVSGSYGGITDFMETDGAKNT